MICPACAACPLALPCIEKNPAHDVRILSVVCSGQARLATVESTYDVAKAIQLVDNHGSLEPFTFQYFNCGMLTIQAARL